MVQVKEEQEGSPCPPPSRGAWMEGTGSSEWTGLWKRQRGAVGAGLEPCSLQCWGRRPYMGHTRHRELPVLVGTGKRHASSAFPQK